MAILGIEPGVAAGVGEMPIATAAWRRMLSRRVRMSGWRSMASGRMLPRMPREEEATKTQGLLTSMQVVGTPSKVSMMLSVGRSLPVLEPLRRGTLLSIVRDGCSNLGAVDEPKRTVEE